MKIFLLIILLLSGCSTLDKKSENYDPIEHEIFLMKQIDPTIQI